LDFSPYFVFQERRASEEYHATQERFGNRCQIPHFENEPCSTDAGLNDTPQKGLGIGMEEICMFEYDPVFGSFGYPSSGCKFNAITVIPQCRILRALKPKGDGGAQEESQGTALTCPW
jgi:hypothetical protein